MPSLALSLGLLGPGAAAASVTVEGRIATAGEPLRGVEVSVAPLRSRYEGALALLDGKTRSEPVEETRSGANGRFLIVVPEPGMWVVRASKEGYAAMAVHLEPLLEDVDLPPLEMPSEETLELRVMTEGAGAVEGARVVAVGESTPWYRSPPEGSWRLARQLARTDEGGRATVSTTGGEELTIAVAAPGFVPRSVKHRGSGRRAIRLEPADERPVRILDHRRRAASGVIVWHGDGPLPVGVTDESGSVTLFDVPDARGPFRFLGPDGAALEEDLPEAEDDAEDDAGADGEAEAPRVVEVILDPPRFLEGRVVSMPHRDPVSGALVWRSPGAGATTRTGPHGEYRLPTATWDHGSLLWGAPGFFVDRMRGDQVPAYGSGPTLVLHRAGAVVGVAVDGEGRPLGDVEVRTRFDTRSLGAFQFNTPHWQRTSGGVARTGTEGRFRLGNLVPGLEYELRFQREGYAPRRLTEEVPAPGSAPEGLTVVLTRGVDVHGRVLDGEEEPVRGAVATLRTARPADVVDRMRRMKDPLPAFTSDSDEEGVFRFTAVPPGRFDLLVEAPGFASAEVPGVEVREAPGETELGTLFLGPEARIRGLVESVDGEPLGGVAVRVVPDAAMLAVVQDQLEPSPDTLTAGDGWFELGGLDPGEAVTLRFDRDGFETGVVRNARAGEEPITVRLDGTRTLVGRVLSPRSETIPDALVMVEDSVATKLPGGQMVDAGKPTSLFDHTDEDGTFRIEGVPGGSVRLHARARGWQEWSGSLDPWGEDGDGSVEIVLQPAAVVRGTVLGEDGQSVVGADVREWAPELPAGVISYRSPLATTDGDGEYRIDDLPPGRARLEARHPAAGRAVREIDARPGENLLDFQLEGGQRVSGRVVGPDGIPVGGARVILGSRRPSWSPPVARTDGAGAFSFEGVAAGQYRVQAEKRGVGRAAEGIAFEVRDRPVEGLEVTLAPQGTVSGRITGLSLEDLARVRIHAGSLLDVGRVDHEGRYEIPGLVAGEWTVIAEVPGSGRRATGTVRLDPEDPAAVLDLDFDAVLVLTGQVLLDGAPAPALEVTVFGARGPVGWAETDGQGSFIVSGLPRGEYRVLVRSRDRSIELERSVDLDADRSIVIRADMAQSIEVME